MTAFDIGGLYLHTLHSELETFRYIIQPDFGKLGWTRQSEKGSYILNDIKC